METLPAEVIENFYNFLCIGSRINFALTSKFIRICKPNLRYYHKKMFKPCIDFINDIKYDVYEIDNPKQYTPYGQESFGSKIVASERSVNYSVRNIKNIKTIVTTQSITHKSDLRHDINYRNAFSHNVIYEFIDEITVISGAYKQSHLFNEVIIDDRALAFKHIFNDGIFRRIQEHKHELTFDIDTPRKI